MNWIATIVIGTALVACSCEARSFDVVLPDDAHTWERTAANVLEDVLYQIVSNRLVSIDGCNPVVFHVGDTFFAQEKGLSGNAFRDEEWSVRSFGGNVVLNGGGPRGALYAVSHFLEDCCDVRFWSDTETDVPEKEGISLGSINLSGRPAFAYRDVCRDAKIATARFAAMRRLNRNDAGEKMTEEWGGAVFSYGPPGTVHTFDRILPWAEFGTTHPEWYSLRDGCRIGGMTKGQLCLSNFEVRRQLLSRVLRNVAAGEADAKSRGTEPPRRYALAQNDANCPCQCDSCRQEAERYGASGFYLKVVNGIADVVAREHPGVKIVTLAYEFTEDPPKGGVRPSDNVIVMLCDTCSSQTLPATDSGNRSFMEKLCGWSAVTTNLVVWDYATVYKHPAIQWPFASEFSMAETFRAFCEKNVSGVFLEHEQSATADFYEVKLYLETMFLENPRLDATRTLVDAFKRYFGPAAKLVFKARKRLYDLARERNARVTFFPESTSFDFVRMEDLEAMSELWDEAEASVREDPKHLARVRKARRSHEKLRHFRQHELRVENGIYVCDAHCLYWDRKIKDVAFVHDEEAPGGEACRIRMEGFRCEAFGPPLMFAFYDTAKKGYTYEGWFPSAKNEGYEWFEFKGVRTPKSSQNAFYVGKQWTIFCDVVRPDMLDRMFTVRFLAKFEGPRNHPGSTRENSISIARIEFVPKAVSVKERKTKR